MLIGMLYISLNNTDKFFFFFKANSYKKEKAWTSPKLRILVLQSIPLGMWKGNQQKGRKYWQLIYLVRKLYLKCIKTSNNSIIKKTNNPIRICKGSEETLLPEDIKMSNKYMERYSTLLVIKTCKSKPW